MIRTIAGFAVRRPVIVILLWLGLVAAGFGVGTGVFERLVPDVGEVPGSESARAQQRLADAAPDGPETLTAVVAGAPATDPALQASVAAASAQAREVPGVSAVSDPLPSRRTGEALLVEVELAQGDGQEDAAHAAAERLSRIDAPEVTVAGGPLSDAEFNEQAQKDVARAELLSTPVVLVLLLVVFGGVLAAGLPLLVAVVGVGGTFGVLFAFSAVSDVSVYAIQVTTMLAVGLAVDYALLVVNRFREERRSTADVPQAIARTVATAGRTVMFSGLTVAVALAGLVVFPDPFLRSMGLAGAAVVVVDMLAALTLLPALLALFGRRISAARRRDGRGFARVARGVQRRPVLTLLVTGGAMAVLAAPVLDLHLSQGDPRMLPTSTDTRQMWDGLTTHFPERATWAGDLQVLADAPADDPGLGRVREAVVALPGVTAVEVEPVGPELTALHATPAAPPDDPATQDTVTAIRDLPVPFEVAVGGSAAELVDYRAMLADRLPWAIALVALGTLLLLFVFTGSVLLPVKAVLTNLLSIGAALGVVVWVFQQGHLAGLFGTEGLGYLHLTVPVLVGAIGFGLSVDYEVFLLSRIRERWLARTAGAAAGSDGTAAAAGPDRTAAAAAGPDRTAATAAARAAVADGLQRTGGIVTAAALVIAVVFAGFIAGGFAPIKAIGLGLVLAVVLDATIVRLLLVPATMTLLGRHSWWLPRPLRRAHARLARSEPAAEMAAGATTEPTTATATGATAS